MTQTTAIHGEKVSLLRVLGPGHVWALGVGIVLVGEYMGWNFAVGKGGALAALIACWTAGLLYTCVAMIDSEVTSTVAAAGGQYAQAKHIVGPLMAFNVGLFLVLAYTMLEAGNAITAGYLVQAVGGMAGFEERARQAVHRAHHRRPCVAQLSRRVRDAHLQPHRHRHRLLRHRRAVRGRSPVDRRRPQAGGAADRVALRLARRHRGAALRPVVLPRHRGHDAGGRRGSLAGARVAARHDDRNDHAARGGDDDLVHLRRSDAVGVSGSGDHAAVRRGAAHRLAVADGVPVRRHHLLDAGLGQRLHQRCLARLVLHGTRSLSAGVVRCRAPGLSDAVPVDRVPRSRRAHLRARRAARSGHHLLDPVGPSRLHLHVLQHV